MVPNFTHILLMERRNFIFGLSALTLSQALPAMAVEPWITEINTYLNSVRSAYAPYTQHAPNGKVTKGRFYMQKPGKMRFDYDDPKEALVVSDGNTIAVFDPKSNQGPAKYPQFSSPLTLLSKPSVDLMNTKYVKQLRKEGNEAFVTMVDPEHPEYGSLMIRFRLGKTTILGWQAKDKGANLTTIEVSEFHTNIALNKTLFDIVSISRERAH